MPTKFPEIKLVIDLDSSHEANHFTLDSKNIQIEQIKLALRCIDKIWHRLSKSNAEKWHVHETIGIFGKRGVGKTSFLLSLAKSINDETDKKNNESDKTSKLQKLINETPDISSAWVNEILPLPLIDPTLMGKSDHILLILIDEIRNKVIERIRDPENNEFQRAWERSFSLLGQGIMQIEGLQRGKKEWYDPTIAFEERISSISHGGKLTEEFKNFIQLSLNILNKKAFLLCLDDMDTRPEVCWQTLECLRKYFVTPQVITLISGDIDLFTGIIRKEMSRQFTFQSNPQFGVFDTRANNILEGLVDQYLLKLIPNRNRIPLLNVSSLVVQTVGEENMTTKVGVSYTNSQGRGDTSPLNFMLSELYQALGLHYPHLMRKYTYALLDTPLRTFRQIIDAILESYDTYQESNYKDFLHRNYLFMENLADMFQNPLYQFGYSNYRVELAALQTSAGIDDLLDKLVLNNYLYTLDDLNPDCSRYASRMSFIVLQAYLTTAYTEKPAMALHYLLKIAMLKQISQYSGYAIDSPEKYVFIRDHLGLEQEKRLYNTGQALSSISWVTNAPQDSPQSTTAVSHRFGSAKVIINQSMDSLVHLKLSPLHPTTLPGEGAHLISFFSFIGLMGDIIGTGHNNFELDEVLRGIQMDTTHFPFRTPEFNQLKSQYKAAESITRPINDSTYSDIFVSSETKRYKGILTYCLNGWRESIVDFFQDKNTRTISAGIFSAIAQRFANSLDHLDRRFTYALSQGQFSVLSYFKECALVFLNAVLIEETLRARETSSINTDLTGGTFFSSDSLYNDDDTPPPHSPLCDNILRCIPTDSRDYKGHLNYTLPLFSLVASFPLWEFFGVLEHIKTCASTSNDYYTLLSKMPLAALHNKGNQNVLNLLHSFPWEALSFPKTDLENK